MPKLWRKEYKDLGGSLHDGVHHSEIEQNEFSFLRNFYQEGASLVRRKGISRLTTGELTPYRTSMPTVSGVFPFRDSSGTMSIMVFGIDDFGIYNEAHRSVVDIPTEEYIAGGLVPWYFEQINAYAYACRRGQPTLLRFNNGAVSAAGIAKPATAPTLAQGGAGSLSAADYIGVVTFYNTTTGAESDYSPVSNTLTLAASKVIGWSGIPISANSQVNARRLYRTLPNQPGIYFFVATIFDNVTTSYTDDSGIDALGVSASTDNGIPPANPVAMAKWRDRLWVTDGKDVYFSRRGFPESFGPTSILRMTPEDGHVIRGMVSTETSLVVGKTNYVGYVVEAGASYALRTLSEKDGLASGQSLKAFQDGLFWHSGPDVMFSTGGTPKKIGDRLVRKTLDNIDPATYEMISAAIWPKRSWYLLSIPRPLNALGSDGDRDDLPLPSVVLCYNYRTGVWTEFDFRYIQLTDVETYQEVWRGLYSFSQSHDSSYGPVMYCTFADGQIYKFDDGDVDMLGYTNSGQLIRAVAVLPEATFDGQMLNMRSVEIRVDNPDHAGEDVGHTLIPFILKDGQEYANGVRALPTTVASFSPRPVNPNLRLPGGVRIEWQRYTLLRPANLVTSVRPGIYYRKRQPIRIATVIADGVVSQRRPFSNFTRE